MTIIEAINKFEIKYSIYNLQTKQKGDFLQVSQNKNLSQSDCEYIRNNKQEIIDEIKKMKEEKELQEKIEYEKEMQKEREKYIDNNEKFKIGLFFTNYGKGIYGLPEFLKEKEKMLLKANYRDIFEFPMSWDGFEAIEITYEEIIKIEEKLNKSEKNEKEAKEKNEKIHYEKCLKKAKEKNEKVILYQTSDICNDPREECNIDTIVTYLYPDGKKETIRSHTW